MIINQDFALEKFLKKVIKCESCFNCCKNSSAFILKNEIQRLSELKVPMYIKNDIYFIKPNSDGRCPNLNQENKCNIYEYRPVACRLFPFYLMNRPNYEKTWVLYKFCPKENFLLHKNYTKQILRFIAYDLEKLFTNEEINEMLHADFVISKYDRLETGFNNLIKILPVQNNKIS